jgi:hypothetical protein
VKSTPDPSAVTKPAAKGRDTADGVEAMADPHKYANAVKEWAEGGMGKAPEVSVCVYLCDCAFDLSVSACVTVLFKMFVSVRTKTDRHHLAGLVGAVGNVFYRMVMCFKVSI